VLWWRMGRLEGQVEGLTQVVSTLQVTVAVLAKPR
jgi:hypothetical protein